MQLPTTPFSASPVQAHQLLSRQGKYFYLPRYQRPYAWTDDNLKEFVSDVNSGLKLVIEGGTASRSALTFLGAAIFLPTTGSGESISPSSNRADAPQDIAIVIDGQQRITTLLMTCAALASQIDELYAKIPEQPQAPMVQSILRRAAEIRNALWRTLGEDRVGTRGNVFHYYPRMIRENDDLWSAEERQAQYTSPIAELLHTALQWVYEREEARWQAEGGRRITFRTNSDSKLNVEFQRCYETLCGYLDEVALGSEDLQSPSSEDLFVDATFSELLKCQASEVDSDLLAEWRAVRPEGRRLDRQLPIVALTRIVLFADYLRHRVFVTEVTAPDEENAFDLFQALNTRGEPLTAYETFKPVVLERVSRQDTGYTTLQSALERVDNVLADAGNEDRGALTQQLLIYAASYENGHKLGKNIREQRSWLKGQLLADGQRRTATQLVEFVLGVDRVAQCHSIWNGWIQGHHRDSLLPDHLAEGRLAAEFLAKAKHTIVVPAITPFIACVEATADGTDDRHQAQRELDSVLRALLATATLWRLAYGGTEGIDDAIRALMSSQSEARISRRRCPYPDRQYLKASQVIQELRTRLSTSGRKARRDGVNLLSAEEWIARAGDLPLYTKVKKFVTIALAAAFDRATPHASHPWQLVDTLDREAHELSHRARWWRYEYNIEHLVPQARAGGLRPEVLHGLGNLTLVPRWVNSSLSAKEWPRKRVLFTLMSERSAIGAEQFLASLRSSDLLDSDETSLERVMQEGMYQEVAKSIAALPAELTEDALVQRGRNLLARVHSRLMQWLPESID